MWGWTNTEDFPIPLPATWWVPTLSAIVVGIGVGQVILSGSDWPFDLRFWQSTAESILTGQTPYVDVPDNKPPGLYLIIVAMEATGHFQVAGAVLGTGAISAIGFGIQSVCQSINTKANGDISVILFIGSIFVLEAWNNPIRLAAIGLMIWGFILAFDSRHLASGLLIGMAGMLIQYSVLALPILIFIWLNDTRSDWSRGIVGLLAPALTFFGGLWLLYGTTALQHGIIWTFAIVLTYIPILGLFGSPDILKTAPEYLQSGVTNASIFIDPISAGFMLVFRFFELIFITGPAILVLLTILQRRENDRTLFLVAVAALLFSLPHIIRSSPTYWLYSLPYLTILASVWYQYQQ